MKTWSVSVPIAGHAEVEVEAEDEESAIEQALSEVQLSDLTEWDALKQFNQGNICYCPSPWEAEAMLVDDGE